MDCLGYGSDNIATKLENIEDVADGEYETDQEVNSADEESLSGEDYGCHKEVLNGSPNNIWSIEDDMNGYDIGEDAFNDGLLEQLKIKENELAKRRKYEYYRWKSKHVVVYVKIAEAISPYLPMRV